MRIAFFTETYLPALNGVSITLSYIKKELDKKGHEVYVFAPKVAGYKDKQKNIVRLRSLKIINAEPEQKMPLPSEFFKLGVKMDVVHAHGGGFFSFLGYQMAVTKGYPFVLTYHTFLEKYTHYFFFKGKIVPLKLVSGGSKLFCNLADVVIVPSEKMKKVLEKYGVTKKIEVVPNPIDLSVLQRGEKGYLRTLLGLNQDTVVLLTACRIAKEKNIDFLIRSFEKISKKAKNTVMVIAGDGPEKTSLEALAKKLSLERKVFFTGYLKKDDMPKVYSDADIFLFASTSETQGMVVPEAAACSLPLVVVKDEAFNGCIEDGVNGYETKEDESIFATKVLDLVENPQKRTAFGEASSALVRKNFNQEMLLDKLVEAYKEAIRIRSKEPRISNRIQSGFNGLKGFFNVVKAVNKRLLG